MMLAFVLNGQVNDSAIRCQVLEKGLVDSLFVFGTWTENGQTETHLKYLGQVTTTEGKTLKVMNSIWIWGASRRATTRLLVYNDKNEYVGNYVLHITSDLPDRMVNGKLIFTNRDNEGCDLNLTTEIDISQGLPPSIFIQCKDVWGDSYRFSSE